MLKKTHYMLIIFMLSISCKNNNVILVDNPHKGQLEPLCKLVLKNEKKFLLDQETAPRPPYIQILDIGEDSRILSFLNPYKKSILFYDYNSCEYIKNLSYTKDGKDIINRPGGYYIKNMDSIYIYDIPKIELVLADSTGSVNGRILLRDESREWPYHYPQYQLSTANPIIKMNNKLLITGQHFPSIPSSRINTFHFSTCLDMETNQFDLLFKYPEELYGFDSNWEGGLSTAVYPELSPNGEIIHSFPVSHNLYISTLSEKDSEKRFAGSNVAGTISSIDISKEKKASNDLILMNYLQNNIYTAIKYDVYRNVYYRFSLQSIPNATINFSKEKKNIVVIIMDENFNYLGETMIGTGEKWNWANSFITSEGLNIEYIEDNLNEDYLVFKIFSIDNL